MVPSLGSHVKNLRTFGRHGLVVPEPSAWGTPLLGFAGLGSGYRRAKKGDNLPDINSGRSCRRDYAAIVDPRAKGPGRPVGGLGRSAGNELASGRGARRRGPPVGLGERDARPPCRCSSRRVARHLRRSVDIRTVPLNRGETGQSTSDEHRTRSRFRVFNLKVRAGVRGIMDDPEKPRHEGLVEALQGLLAAGLISEGEATSLTTLDVPGALRTLGRVLERASERLRPPTPIEQVDPAFAEYHLAVGKVARAWNTLHEDLGRLFVTVSGSDKVWTEPRAIKVALAIWYAAGSDRVQRDILRAVVNANSDRWEKRPKALADLKWLLKCADEVADARNTAVHAPVSIYIGDWGADNTEIWPAYFAAEHPRIKRLDAKNLHGKRLIAEFEWCQEYAWTLIGFIQKLQSVVSGGRPWPDRPPIPTRKAKP